MPGLGEQPGKAVAQRRIEALARGEHQAGGKAADRVAAGEQRHPPPLLQLQDAERMVIERVLVDLEQLVARIGIEDGEQRLPVMTVGVEARAAQGDHIVQRGAGAGGDRDRLADVPPAQAVVAHRAHLPLGQAVAGGERRQALRPCPGAVREQRGREEQRDAREPDLLHVSRPFTERSRSSEVKGKLIAVPGTMTTAFLILKLFEPDFRHVVVPFDKVFERVAKGKADAGLIIHEGQLTFSTLGLHKVVDLGEWWHKETKLPLPLGGNVVRKDLGAKLIAQISYTLRKSIEYALEHRDEALNYAMQFARDMEEEVADKFVGMYVNDRTLNYGQAERRAIQLLLDMGHQKKIINQRVRIEFAE